MVYLLVLITSIAMLWDVVEAHGGLPGAPKLFGKRVSIRAKSRRRRLENVTERDLHSVIAGPHLDSRTNTNGQCGATFGSCAPGICCSAAGYCGNGPAYCTSPDCQISYGPGCDGNVVPSGGSTASVPRPRLGSQPYGGGGIDDCIVNGVIALTFDDGPYIYTSDILDILQSYNATATFFITGNNLGKGGIDNSSTIYPALIKRMYAEGHQIASHTWSHEDLSNVTAQERLDQMYNNEAAFRNILGFFPTYMRPPYSSCDTDCQTAMGTLGYHIIFFDLDTDDYDNDSPLLIQNAKNNFDNAIKGTNPDSSDFLAIAHDIHEQTAHNLTQYMLVDLLEKGYKTATLGECLGDPATNWYRSATPTNSSISSTSSAIAKPSTSAISPDATCGGTIGYTCLNSVYGNCCSAHGYCGSSGGYCLPANGCQSLFGTCSGSSSTSTSPTSSSVSASNSAVASHAISVDATCGGTVGNTCLGSVFGNCCSSAGYCGSTTDYCAAGCQSAFGSCNITGLLSAYPVSADAICGGTSNATCIGSAFGNCCSHAGYCGSTDAYCLTANGCQTIFGSCGGA